MLQYEDNFVESKDNNIQFVQSHTSKVKCERI